MAATIQVIKDSSRETVIKLTNDGSAETGVLKVDASSLSGAVVGESYHELMVTNITWCVLSGYSVKLLWDGVATADMVVLSASGALRYTGGEYILLKNTATTPNGDIKATTIGAGAAPTYTIVLTLAKGTNFTRGGTDSVG